MLETIDFAMVFKGYRRNEQPEKLGIASIESVRLMGIVHSGRNEQSEKPGIATLGD